MKKIKENIYEIPQKGDMLVPGKIFVSSKLAKNIEDKSVEQISNVASLPGIVGSSLGMPDIHRGFGFTIGGVAAFDSKKGIVSPGGVGFDINCGVRLLKTNLTKKQIQDKQTKIAKALNKKIPSGLGRGSKFQITYKEFPKILKEGAQYMIKKGFGTKKDQANIEEKGKMKNANPKHVSQKALKRGIGQIGTLGAGNHFLDVLYIDKIFDKPLAKKLNLKTNQILIMFHTGSRGLGHQVASEYIKKMDKKYKQEKFTKNGLTHAPITSSLGKNYISAMNCASNYAFANRQLITHWIREELTNIFPESKTETIYDICHNIAKFEMHKVKGKKNKQKLCVHRKGATRSGKDELVIIPGSMGTASYLLKGTKKAEELTFASTVHGAGRAESRSSAAKRLNGQKIKTNLKKTGIVVEAGSMKNLSTEAPEVYKDVEEVVKVATALGINKKVARFKPLIVITG